MTYRRGQGRVRLMIPQTMPEVVRTSTVAAVSSRDASVHSTSNWHTTPSSFSNHHVSSEPSSCRTITTVERPDVCCETVILPF